MHLFWLRVGYSGITCINTVAKCMTGCLVAVVCAVAVEVARELGFKRTGTERFLFFIF